MIEKLSDYKYALDQSSIVAITDQKGQIIFVNHKFCLISKYSEDELLGRDHRIINSGYHSKEFIKNIWVTIANGKVWKGEIKNRAKDGTTYWVATTIVPFLNNEGKPYQYVSIRSDITEKKKGIETIKKNNIRALKDAKNLENKNKQLVDFCNIVSHNLRAPLVNISMLVDFLEQNPKETDRKLLLKKIRQVVDNLMEIFNELVESLQVEQDTDLKSDRVILEDCIHKILIGFEIQIQQFGAEIELKIEETPLILFPNKYLVSILTNLISNALKYSSPERKPIISIETKKTENNAVLLTVTDNGLGIDLKLYKDQIFKIRKTFHKHKDAKGFGLFMLKTQVEAMKSKIWLESEPNKGSTFFVEFSNQVL